MLAYILARQFQEFESLARRICTIFFLATPHRGADLAQTLTKILHMVSGPRPFVQDLHRNSLATQSINDEFPRHCKDMQLFSFYETLPMNYGIGKGLIVDKDLAVLGYANERTAYLNSNHRDVCRYNTPTDPDYLTVRNALASTINSFRSHVAISKRDLNNEQRRILEGFLGVSDAPEDDLMDIDAQRMRGSCEWLLEKKSFRAWRDSVKTQVYWVSAKPATGKSVLSGFIIKHLKGLGLDCSFYFFTHGDKVKATISSFLRSMAWQMAVIHPEILQTVLDIHEKDDQLAKAGYRTIWRKLFLDGILTVKLDRPQYWVVDALDECKADSDLVPLLLKVSEMCRGYVLVTSRKSYESHRQIIHPEIKVFSEEISVEDTRVDISLYLKANMDYLPSINEKALQEMVATILTKSAGCFLWVNLVLQELRQVHTAAEIRQVLEDIPSDMGELYSRILDSMSRAPYGKLLAKAILTWTVCSARPLTTKEMHHALQIDMKDNIDSVQKSIVASCGQLVYVDSHSRVQMVHHTARDFLLQPENTSEFVIIRKSGHKRVAMACLEYLNGNEMKGPRHRSLRVSNVPKERCPFVAYACTSLFGHITQVSSTDDDLLVALATFLSSSNVLSWIEYVAQNADLNYLIQSSKSIKNFLQRRSKHMSPFGKEVAILDSWATDLFRLVTKFGKDLLGSPASIFHLIPPFCPLETVLKKQFAAPSRGIVVLGLSATTWDDCVSTIIHPREVLTTLACSNKYFAVGMVSGQLVIYHEMTCQEVRRLQHGEPVRVLQFGETGNVLASAGMKAVRLWDVTSWQQLWKFDIAQECMSLAFTDGDKLLLGALKNNHLMLWDLTTGLLGDFVDWAQDLEAQPALRHRHPVTAAFCMGSSLMAVVYRGQDILLWDLERDALHETYGKETGARPGARVAGAGVTGGLVFSRDPNAALLAASYSDGDLILFDTREGLVKETTVANAHTLASSPNGHTLATGDSTGTIQLFDFETLKFLYRISSEDYGIRSLAFSGDGHRLLDIGGSQCRVWDPMVLIRQDTDEESSDTVSVSTAPQEFKFESTEDMTFITSLACHDSGEVFFCGKDDRSVYLYETKSARQSQKLFSHANGTSVVFLSFSPQTQILSSIDSSSRVMTHKLVRQQKVWEAVKDVFDYRTGVAVDQLLSNGGNTRILLCSAQKDMLFSTTPTGSTIIKTILWEDRGPYRWGSHPSNQDQLILITNNVAHIYEWETLRKLTGDRGILLEDSTLLELPIRSITSSLRGTLIATMSNRPLGPHSKSKLLLWNTSDFSVVSESAAPIPGYQYLADQIEFLIGVYGQSLVFLHSSRWICSADLETLNVDNYTRHFFIPADWLSTNVGLMIEVSANGDIIFVKREEVAVIKQGLEAIKQRPNNAAGKRPPLIGGTSSSSSSGILNASRS
ncbi:hypothetical protein GP486_002685 [Trichoglossum hirsutum]|uniref:NACHT domain-containing protein n=1 Tax=Trichoglossum hirsutum TaxID=265104 RepID=A0A9P8LER6_9PEZI|nr:hypothetical protein GP486_002685 [Trichoglossum hirsutum]